LSRRHRHKAFGITFGEVDVPALEHFDTPLQPFDPSRSLTLNPKHPVVAVLVGFIGSKLERIRQDLVSAERDAREEEEARRLARQGDDLAAVLNEDFMTQINKLREIRSATSRPGAAAALHGGGAPAGEEHDIWIEGLETPGELDDSPITDTEAVAQEAATDDSEIRQSGG
jgi:hypothetical protein